MRSPFLSKNPIAENIGNIDFLYLLKDSDGNKSQTRTPGTGNFKDIVAVQVSMLAQSKTEDRKAETTSNLPCPFLKLGNSTDSIDMDEN